METPEEARARRGGWGGRGADRCALCLGIHTKGRPSRRCVPGNSTHARRAHFSRRRGAVGGPPGGRGSARRSPRVGSRTPSACSRTRCPGSAKPAPGDGGRGARAVGTCSPRASPAPPPGRSVRASPPAASRLPAAAKTTPPGVLSAVRPKVKTNSGLRGCCPPPGAPIRSPPLRRPPERWRNERPRLSLSTSSAPRVGRARGTQASLPLSRPRARGRRGFPRLTRVGTRKLVGAATPGCVPEPGSEAAGK